jgi:hypothetical protein
MEKEITMRMLRLIPTIVAVLAFMAWLSVAVLADPVIEVSPPEHNFGNVEVGNSATTIITISNVGGQLYPVGYDIFVTYNEGDEEDPEDDFIEIEVKDEDGNPIRSKKYTLTLEDGTTRSGRLDKNGRGRVDGVQPGTVAIEFPSLKLRKEGIQPLPPNG